MSSKYKKNGSTQLGLVTLSFIASLSVVGCGGGSDDESNIPNEGGFEFEFVPMAPLELNSFSISDNGTVHRKQEVGSRSQRRFDRSFDPKTNTDFVDDKVNKSQSIQAYGNNFEANEDSADVKFEMYAPKSDADLDSKDSNVADAMPAPITYHRRVDLKDSVTGEIISYTTSYLPEQLYIGRRMTIDKGKIIETDSMEFTYFSLYTILSDLDKIPESVTFPANAMCYERMGHEASKPVLLRNDGSDDSSSSVVTDLDAWVAKSVDKKGDYQSATDMKVGRDNRYDAKVLKFSYGYDSAMLFNNSVFEAKYVPTSSVRVDGISKLDYKRIFETECHVFNDIAADFIEEQIVKYYK